MASHRIDQKKKASVVSKMAQYMIDNPDNCTRETLLLEFTQEEVDTCHADARAEANSRQNREAA
ncbi:hypothetical protein [Agrobacterium sp. LAD9]|uniref:hypothetical protein n=1 Tax=Agrobacterium sp. LAD9 TaxID=2055153 RepID=UPI000D1E7B0D|nr:hypothetical protein [Agrobacterium sp. LAD9]